MADLEQRLSELGQAIQFPETPAFVVSVRRRLSPARPPYFDPRRLAIAAAILVVAIGALLAFPTTRDAIAGFFGLKGVLIQRVPSLASPGSTRGGSAGQRLNLGQPSTFAAAQGALPYAIAYPHSLGPPDAVYLVQPVDRHAVALVWNPSQDLPQAGKTGVGALLIEFPGRVQPDFFMKELGPDATLEPVNINASPGYWIGGKPHGFFFLDTQGVPQEDTFRLAGNTVLWDQGSLTIRIESGLSKAAALALANSTD